MAAADTATEELPDYRPVSPLAVAALAAGLASSLIVFTPLASMVPLIASTLALVALSRIRRSEGRLVGCWPALGGLALAVGFSSQAFTAALTEGMVARHRAKATATAWIDAVQQGRFEEAVAASSPALLPMPRDRGHETRAPEGLAETFREVPAVRAVNGCKTVPTLASVTRLDEAQWAVHAKFENCSVADDLVLSVGPRMVTRRGRIVEEWLVTGFTFDR